MRFVEDLSKIRKLTKKKEKKLDLKSLVKIYRVFGNHYRKYSKVLVVSFLFLVATIGVALLAPWPLKLILDYVLLKQPLPDVLDFLNPLLVNNPKQLLILLGLSIVVLAILQALFSYINKFLVSSTGARINADIRERVFIHLQRLSLSFHDTSKSGDTVYLLTADLPKMKKILIDLPQDIVQRLGTFGSAIIIMLSLDWRLGLIAVSTVPPLFLFTKYFGTGMNKAMRKVREKEGEVASIIGENVTGMALVQAYGREDTERARFDLSNQETLKQRLKTYRLSKTYGRIVDLLVILSTAGVLYYGGRFAFDGEILPGTLVVFVAYMKEIFGITRQLSELFLKVSGTLVSGQRVLEMVENDMVIRDHPNATRLTYLKGQVEFRDVNFAYIQGKSVLENLSFQVNSGETIALIGHSGAGKSTLISLLLRFHDPQQGNILIDGQDLHNSTVKSLRNQITILLQEANLFQMTVRDNIAFGKIDASEEEVIEAAKLAEAHDFIMRMPDGYETMILERGENLSGGQKQRINIARAIIRDKPIVILDEPAAGLDAEAEARINNAIRRLTEAKTTFIVAHRFSSIVNADKILLLGEDQSAHFGSHQELTQKSAEYREFYELQFDAQSSFNGTENNSNRDAEHEPRTPDQPIYEVTSKDNQGSPGGEINGI